MPMTGGPFSPLRVGDAQPTDGRSRTFRRAVSANSYVTLPGSSGNYVSTPDTAALDITGDIEIVVRALATSWTITQNVGGKWITPSDRSYTLYTEATTGKLWFWLSANGIDAGFSIKSSTGVPFSAGQAGWIKVTYRTSDRRVQFFTAADQAGEPTSWTQLGTDVTQPIGTTTYAGAGTFHIGSDSGAGNMFGGRVYRFIVRNGIDGTTAADFNPNLYASGSTFTSTDGLVYTLNGTAAITKA